jgi:hypothetical protein
MSRSRKIAKFLAYAQSFVTGFVLACTAVVAFNWIWTGEEPTGPLALILGAALGQQSMRLADSLGEWMKRRALRKRLGTTP